MTAYDRVVGIGRASLCGISYHRPHGSVFQFDTLTNPDGPCINRFEPSKDSCQGEKMRIGTRISGRDRLNERRLGTFWLNRSRKPIPWIHQVYWKATRDILDN